MLEAVTDGQGQWRDGQRKAVIDWSDKLQSLNGLMRDKRLAIPVDDLLEYLKK
jgi:hypothetical protein